MWRPCLFGLGLAWATQMLPDVLIRSESTRNMYIQRSQSSKLRDLHTNVHAGQQGCWYAFHLLAKEKHSALVESVDWQAYALGGLFNSNNCVALCLARLHTNQSCDLCGSWHVCFWEIVVQHRATCISVVTANDPACHCNTMRTEVALLSPCIICIITAHSHRNALG
jgi:hypothetical protein